MRYEVVSLRMSYPVLPIGKLRNPFYADIINLDAFDYLIVFGFDKLDCEEFIVRRVVRMSRAAIQQYARAVNNAYRLHVSSTVWAETGVVEDLTSSFAKRTDEAL